MDITRTIAKATAGLKNCINLMLARGVLTATNDSGGLQTAQAALLEDELRDGLERMQNYGFTSHPHGGADLVVGFLGGNRDHGIILAIDDRRYRLALSPGEVAVYTDEGDYIKLKRNNSIEVKTLHLTINAEDDCSINTKVFAVNAADSLDLNSPQTAINSDALSISSQSGGAANAELTGSLSASGDLKGNGGTVSLNKHTHSGVQSGPSNSGQPVGG